MRFNLKSRTLVKRAEMFANMTECVAHAQSVCSGREGDPEPPAGCTIHLDGVACDVDDAEKRDAALRHQQVGNVGCQCNVVNVLLQRMEVEQPLHQMKCFCTPAASHIDSLSQSCGAIECDADVLVAESAGTV